MMMVSGDAANLVAFPVGVGTETRTTSRRSTGRLGPGPGFEWVVPRTYLKTVATVLDQRGLSARTIADQLGHARISMTQDVYLGRRAVDQAAASALEQLPVQLVELAECCLSRAPRWWPRIQVTDT